MVGLDQVESPGTRAIVPWDLLTLLTVVLTVVLAVLLCILLTGYHNKHPRSLTSPSHKLL